MVSLLMGLQTEEVRALRWGSCRGLGGGQWEQVSEAGLDHQQLVDRTRSQGC